MLAACWPDGIRTRPTGWRIAWPAAALPSAGSATTPHISAGDRLAPRRLGGSCGRRPDPRMRTSFVDVGCEALGEGDHIDHLLHRLARDLVPLLVRIIFCMI